MKTIEACRVHMFDIITQYKAIFSDEDSLSSETSETILFHSWVQKKVSQFLAILEQDLSHQRYDFIFYFILTRFLNLSMKLIKLCCSYGIYNGPVNVLWAVIFACWRRFSSFIRLGLKILSKISIWKK